MYEVELKVPADLEAVRGRLETVGAEARGTVIQEDTYFDAPHRSFPETDEALRIRAETAPDGDTTRLTYKGPQVDDASKTREELETQLGNAKTAATILERLGFSPVATVRKERDRFAVDGYEVTLDAVDDVGEFVEVETEAPASGIDEAREGAVAVLERLALDPADNVRTSYLEMLLDGE